MKRTTVCFDDDVYKALKTKSSEVSIPISDLINDAVRSALLEVTEDLEIFRKRATEPTIDFETFATQLRYN